MSRPARTVTQNSTLDQIAAGTPGIRQTRRPIPLSLRPGPAVMAAIVAGHEWATVIQDAWRFNLPVTVMPADEFDSLVERCATTFIGRSTDRAVL